MKEKRQQKKKKREQFIPYDYETAYNKKIEDMHEWMVEQMLSISTRRRGTAYALKEIRAGEQLELEIYPQFTRKEDIPIEGQIKRDNSRAQKNLNDKNAKKYVERLINQNFNDGDIWITLTYDDAHLPPDGDIDTAIKNMQKYISRINYQRRKRGLPNAKYIYVTEYDPAAEIRWHNHMVMDGALDMDTVESCWKQSSRNEVRKLRKDENGLSGLANYIVKEKDRIKSERRWNSSKGLKKPDIRVVHSKQQKKGQGNYKKIGTYVDGMVKNQGAIGEIVSGWYPDHDFANAEVYYNGFNGMFYIHARMRRKKDNEKASGKLEKTAMESGRIDSGGNSHHHDIGGSGKKRRTSR